ncbi:glycosyltransferase family 2 protein [Soonwooa sp.]|uniref:glycosyltransferase family 2 protein n=1 Tax=Soonwooa sp. TaxID=1938592 RepID=UPI0026382073|nr:glycosyltransferase family 2 protein [Soonwooa sp.]
MRLSICIPIHNFDVNNLVSALKSEIETKNLDAEIVLIDDASNAKFQEINSKVKVDTFEILDQNIGRSAIRNLFLKYVNGDYLLFLDCDGKIISDNFISDYLQAIKLNQPDVIYGGRIVDAQKPEKDFQLRWNYAQKRENLSLNKRIQKQYLGFQTNNFVIKRAVFNVFKFDEKLKNYGYEDLLFAMELKSAGIHIQHIDNPIFNNDIETNSIFTGKAGEAAESLALILKDDKTKDKVADLKLTRAYRQLKNYHLESLFNLSFYVFEPFLKTRLKMGNAHLRILDFYKLGILSRKMSKD